MCTAHTVIEIPSGAEKVRRHIERLRTEAPRIYAALEPLLQDLRQWMASVEVAIDRKQDACRGCRR